THALRERIAAAFDRSARFWFAAAAAFLVLREARLAAAARAVAIRHALLVLVARAHLGRDQVHAYVHRLAVAVRDVRRAIRARVGDRQTRAALRIVGSVAALIGLALGLRDPDASLAVQRCSRTVLGTGVLTFDARVAALGDAFFGLACGFYTRL